MSWSIGKILWKAEEKAEFSDLESDMHQKSILWQKQEMALSSVVVQMILLIWQEIILIWYQEMVL